MPEEGSYELFLKYLPVSATEKSLRKHFKECQSLKDVRVKMDSATGECKGMGWLVLGDAGDAEWLVSEWNSEPRNAMDGRHVEISYANAPGNWYRRPGQGLSFPCRYGVACVRRDCTFQHPAGWDAAKAHGKTLGDSFAPSRIVCRYGTSCKHPNCFFAHPDGRTYDGTNGKSDETKNGHQIDKKAKAAAKRDKQETPVEQVDEKKGPKKSRTKSETELVEKTPKKKRRISSEVEVVSAGVPAATPSKGKKKKRVRLDADSEVGVSGAGLPTAALAKAAKVKKRVSAATLEATGGALPKKENIKKKV